MSDRPSWEYSARVVQPGGDILPALNAWGQDGWELCGQITTPEHPVVFLCKRPASRIVIADGEHVQNVLAAR